MAKIKWTPQSLEDIEAIANFITKDQVITHGCLQ